VSSFGFQDHALNYAQTSMDRGVGIRVPKGDQTGYSFTEHTAQQMVQATRTAADIAHAPDLRKLAAFQPLKPLQRYRSSRDVIQAERKKTLLAAINEKVFALDKRIVKCSASITEEATLIFLANGGLRPCIFQ